MRTFAHSLVTESVEAALTRCVPDSPPLAVGKAATMIRSASGAGRDATTGAQSTAALATPSPAIAKSAMETPRTLSSVVRTMAVANGALSTVRRWPSPEDSTSHSSWKMPGAGARMEGAAGSKREVQASRSPGGTAVSPTHPAAGFAVASTLATVATTGARGNGGGGGGSRSPSLSAAAAVRQSVARRREGRREQSANDADDRMSWSSFDSLDVRLDDQVRVCWQSDTRLDLCVIGLW